MNVGNNPSVFKLLEGKVFAVDFDGTLFERTENFPEIGKPIYSMIVTIRRIHKVGGTIILWTCREGKALDGATAAMREYNVPYDYVNENPPERIALYGNDCRKIGADVYIDDRAVNNSLELEEIVGWAGVLLGGADGKRLSDDNTTSN